MEFVINKATLDEIAAHLTQADGDFVPALSGRVVIDTYAGKIAERAVRFEAWDGTLVGLLAAYCNNVENGVSFLTSLSVLKQWTGQGLAANLLNQFIDYSKKTDMQRIALEVHAQNGKALALYRKAGFVALNENDSIVTMELDLKGGNAHAG